MKRKKIIISTITLILLAIVGFAGVNFYELSNYSRRINSSTINRVKVERPFPREITIPSIPNPPVKY